MRGDTGRDRWVVWKPITVEAPFGMGRYSACYQMINMNTSPSTNSFIYNALMTAKYSRAILGRKFVGVTDQYLI